MKDVDRIVKAHSVAADEGWISKIDQLGLSSLCLFHDPRLSAAGETSSVHAVILFPAELTAGNETICSFLINKILALIA